MEEFDQIVVAENGITEKRVGICVAIIGKPYFPMKSALVVRFLHGELPAQLQSMKQIRHEAAEVAGDETFILPHAQPAPPPTHPARAKRTRRAK